jgi:hypothetical protein
VAAFGMEVRDDWLHAGSGLNGRRWAKGKLGQRWAGSARWAGGEVAVLADYAFAYGRRKEEMC